MCQIDAMTMVGEGRAYAAVFLRKEADNFPEITPLLQQAAALFSEEYRLVRSMAELLDGFSMGEKQARRLALRETRQSIAYLIGKCEQAEQNAAHLNLCFTWGL